MFLLRVWIANTEILDLQPSSLLPRPSFMPGSGINTGQAHPSITQWALSVQPTANFVEAPAHNPGFIVTARVHPATPTAVM